MFAAVCLTFIGGVAASAQSVQSPKLPTLEASMRASVPIVATSAQTSTWSLEAYFSAPRFTPAAVVSNKFGELTGILGHKDWKADLKWFVGKDTTNATLGGVEAGHTWKVADQLGLWAGVAIQAKEKSPVGAGISAGLSYTAKF